MNDAEITLIRYRMDRSKEALSAAENNGVRSWILTINPRIFDRYS